ncbi:MAG: hypothetical protein QM233_09030 [Candidatus Cloacimonadota bacterium]|jgi:hypothetical protein|nr:hypothetical protein [Candidatus Cloacimonadota bacterium]
MKRKSITLLIILIAMGLALLLLSGCGKSGNRFANQAPTIKITSYEGADDSDLLSPYADSVFAFQQKIYWHATDPDGVITGFAYRVSRVYRDNSGAITRIVPIATPGNDSIDDGQLTPSNVLETLGTGWVLHTSGDNPTQSIWTTQKYATINFPAADTLGNPEVIESLFEVIAIDNRGDITKADPRYSNPPRSEAWRSFNAQSVPPECIVSTTKGNPNGKDVGSGLRLMFSMRSEDPFISPIPSKFKFAIVKSDPTGVHNNTQDIVWHDTATSLNDTKIEEFLLTRHTTPSLTYDYDEGGTEPQTKTKIYAVAFDMAGVASAVPDSIYFAVKPGFRPKTITYHQRIYALGDHHYIDYVDGETLEILPFTIIGGVQRFATFFYVDSDSTNSAVHSQNLKVWLRWGWSGEYGKISGNVIEFTNNPFDKKMDAVLDGETGENYYSELTHFHLRLDGQPYNYAPLAGDETAHVTDPNGDRWLRIPINSPLGQTLVLTSLQPGTHTFQVRCEDLQGEVDLQPAEFTFNVAQYIPPASRNGILIIDDDEHHNAYSPDDIVQAKYESMLADYTGPKVFMKRHYGSGAVQPGEFHTDKRYRQLSPSELMKYKLVIYHNDNPSKSGELKLENDGITQYLIDGGNMLISHTSQLSAVLTAFSSVAQRTFLHYMNVPYRNDSSVVISSSLQVRPFFQAAIGQNVNSVPFPDINLQFNANGVGEPSFNQIVELKDGLSAVTYFPLMDMPGYESYKANVIYRMRIKNVGTPPDFPANDDEYNKYNNKAVGFRKVNPNGARCYLLGFPLSYMREADARALMNRVISDCSL